MYHDDVDLFVMGILAFMVGGFVMFMVTALPWIIPEYECERVHNVYDCEWVVTPTEGE